MNNQQQIERARELLVEGNFIREVARATGLSRQRITAIQSGDQVSHADRARVAIESARRDAAKALDLGDGARRNQRLAGCASRVLRRCRAIPESERRGAVLEAASWALEAFEVDMVDRLTSWAVDERQNGPQAICARAIRARMESEIQQRSAKLRQIRSETERPSNGPRVLPTRLHPCYVPHESSAGVEFDVALA